jgi:hypothetical protein
MMILPMLLMLAVQDAPDTMAAPAKADSTNILYAPSRSLRSSSAAVAGVPASPVTVRLQCTVETDTGTPVSCLPLEANAKPIISRAELARRTAAWESGAAAAAPAVTVAIQRVRFTRIRATPPADDKPPVPVQMLFTETVGAGDVVKLGAPTGTITSSDMEMDERPDGAILTAYYPAQALRSGIQARIKANCRVMPDRKLFCRDAQLISPDAAITPEIAAEFRNATYQVFDAIRLAPLSKTGDPVVGRDVDMRISFVLPS